MKEKYHTGLVLSGGGSRGFAHLGVIAALQEKGIQPDIISGVSAGSIVGAFIAAGKSPEEILDILKKGGFFSYTKINFPKDGLFKLDGLREVIHNEIPVRNIEDLNLPFVVCVSNLNKGTVEYRDKGPLGETVLASASIPILFAPVNLNGEHFVDGGLMDNVPVKPLEGRCERIIVSNISPINPQENINNIIKIATRTVYMSVNSNFDQLNKTADIYIEPPGIEKYELLTSSHAQELFDLGYKSALKKL